MTDRHRRPSADALLRTGRFFTRRETSRGPAGGVPRGRPRGRRLLPGPLEPRQGRAVHPRGELHRLLLVEGLRQGRDHHLGDPADRLPLGRPGLPGVRAPRLPARGGVLLVHLLPDPGPLPLRPWRAGRDVPRGEGPARRPGRGVGRDHRRPGQAAPLPVRARQGRARPVRLGRGGGDRRRRARPHHQGVRPGPDRRASPRSRRCRWSATPSARGSSSSSAAR